MPAPFYEMPASNKENTENSVERELQMGNFPMHSNRQ
ncbi:hypothetical protein T4B_13455 [Trichinella pseudospiralis]|uniref:Uncharacterized protein n=1 Tax=Trichinella pseudospiralis TaxID=6337 RepID=A0A0V1GCY4_TRIPS|nr:hypothetical protein T4B_13455 [Trichinella pseudospiralis]